MTASFIQWFNDMVLLGSFVVLSLFFFFYALILISIKVIYVQRPMNKSLLLREKGIFKISCTSTACNCVFFFLFLFGTPQK